MLSSRARSQMPNPMIPASLTGKQTGPVWLSAQPRASNGAQTEVVDGYASWRVLFFNLNVYAPFIVS
jgi:hypothetical protein